MTGEFEVEVEVGEEEEESLLKGLIGRGEEVDELDSRGEGEGEDFGDPGRGTREEEEIVSEMWILRFGIEDNGAIVVLVKRAGEVGEVLGGEGGGEEFGVFEKSG